MNRLNLLVFLLAVAVCVAMVLCNSSIAMLEPMEAEALWELGHVVFGIGIGAFITIFYFREMGKWNVLFFSLVCILIWECLELYLGKFVFHTTLGTIDTILDIIITTGFACLYVRSINENSDLP